VAFVSRVWELTCARQSCFQPPPADTLKDTAEPLSQEGGASVIRKGKKYCIAAMRERSEKKCERNSPADTKIREKGGEDMLQLPEQRFPCSL